MPRTFTPTAYKARLAISDHIDGHIEIAGELTQTTPVIWLHGAHLRVTSARATSGTRSVDLHVSSTFWDGHRIELIALEPEHPMPPGRWTLVLDYRASIVEQAYVESWGPREDGRDVTRGAFAETVHGARYVFTQFEPMYARRVFPCLDEPDLKVPWQLTLDVEKDLVVASNTAIARESSLDSRHKRVEFAPTQPLPSYLVAFAAGPFDIVDAGVSKSGVPIRVLVPKGHAASFGLHAQSTSHVLDALEDWFQIPYAYGKLDLVAVPQTSPRWLAMENPGLVTFNAQLGTPPVTSEVRRRWLEVISHELAHQWFGNLVTLGWWNDIWLNESFARWISTKITSQLEPRWQTAEHTEARESAMGPWSEDRKMRAVRAPSQESDTSEKVGPYFNGRRGAQLLRMLEAFIGPGAFQTVIRDYVREHAHGNVTTTDFVAAVSKVSTVSLDDAFVHFLDRPGLPQITFDVRCDRSKNVVQLWSTPMETWSVPVCVAYGSGGKRAQQCILLEQGASEITLPAKTCPTWVMPNVAGAGLYTTKWSSQWLKRVVNNGWTSLTTEERAVVLSELPQVSDDTLLLAIAPQLIEAGDPMSLSAGAEMLESYASAIPADLRQRFNAWIQRRLGAAARAVHFRASGDEDILKTRANLSIVRLVAATDDAELQREATQLAADHSKIDKVFAVSALHLAARTDPQVARKLFDAATTLTDSHQRGLILAALIGLPSALKLFTQSSESLRKLGKGFTRQLLATTCDSSQRDDAVVFAEQLLGKAESSAVAARIDACMARTKRLESTLRAWVAALPIR